MRKKLTKEQQYNRDYYLSHKDDPDFRAMRARNEKAYKSKATTKRKRNAKLRERWATDAEYRKQRSEYMKAWRERRKAAAMRAKKKRSTRR